MPGTIFFPARVFSPFFLRNTFTFETILGENRTQVGLKISLFIALFIYKHESQYIVYFKKKIFIKTIFFFVKSKNKSGKIQINKKIPRVRPQRNKTKISLSTNFFFLIIIYKKKIINKNNKTHTTHSAMKSGSYDSMRF